MAETDISKIVGLIMENPKLIEEIKSLANDGAKKEGEVEAVNGGNDATEATDTVETGAKIGSVDISRVRRRELLSALKPYVSEKRAGAIDSIVTIADILDAMRSK